MKLRGMAAAWFRREDFPRWCDVDPDFEPDYGVWLEKMEKAVARYQAAGVPIIRTIILPDEFLAWSKANGKGVGTTDRATYAAFKAVEHGQMEKRP